VAADQCVAERRGTTARRTFIGSWRVAGVDAAADGAPAAAAAAAIIRKARAVWKGEGFALFCCQRG
jgi:hypothetical protein